MTCLSTEEIAALYDGILPAHQAVQARSHMAACKRCAHEFKILHRLLTQLNQAPAPPPGLADRTMANRSRSRRVNLRSGKGRRPRARR